MGFKRPESVLVVVYNEDNQILCLQRQDDPDFWQSITGTMEVGEEPLVTAIREVAEEIGVDVNSPENGYHLVDARVVNQYAIRKEWQYRYGPGNTVNTEYVFYLEIAKEEPVVLTEHLAYNWLSLDKALALLWSPSNVAAVKRLQSYLV